MRLGIISDVHSNCHALDAVLANFDSVDHWFHAGDVVGYGPAPAATIERFHKVGIKSVQGNHDRAVADKDSTDLSADHAVTVAEQTNRELDDDSLSYLASLPVERRVEIDGFEIHIVHGAPGEPSRYVYPDAVPHDLVGDADLLVLGHTHFQFCIKHRPGYVLNPGSVGFPRDGDQRAAVAIVDTGTDAVELHRVSYPVEDFLNACREAGRPTPVYDRLKK